MNDALEPNGARVGDPQQIEPPAVPAPPPLPELLLPGEAELLADCEATMERHMRSAMEFNLALCAIRDKRLYRAKFNTMEEYCQTRWQLTARRVRQLVDASELAQRLVGEMGNVNPGSLFIPAGEHQMRPLLSLPPEHQRATWEEAVKTAPKGRVTRRHVEQVVQERRQALGLTVPSPVAEVTPVTPPSVSSANANGTPTTPLRPRETQEDRLIAKADRTIADMCDLIDEAGTADSEEAAELRPALETVEKFREKQRTLKFLQAARGTPKPFKMDVTGAEPLLAGWSATPTADPMEILTGDHYETRDVGCARCGVKYRAVPWPDQEAICFRPRCSHCGSSFTYPLSVLTENLQAARA